MKTIYLDIFSGISGDMFIGAMLDLGVSANHLEHELEKLGLREFHLHIGRGKKASIDGVKFDVHVGEHSHGHGHDHHHHDHDDDHHEHGHHHEEEDEHGHHDHHHAHGHTHEHSHGTIKHSHYHEHEHEHGEHEEHARHGHDHEEHHEHAHGPNFSEIKLLIHRSALSPWVKEKAIAIFARIARAEGKIHGMPADAVHFHEVGAVDSIVDIVGACICLEALGKPRVFAAHVTEGTGFVNCAHGRFPIPAPATMNILAERGVPISQCEERAELVTPTGAAILAEFVEEFGPMRDLAPEKVGFGLGTRDNKTRPNVLRAILGKATGQRSDGLDWETDTVLVLETNLDDINAEILGHFVEKCLAEGALDAFHTPVQMKKNRPGVLLTVLVRESEGDKFSELILRETTALGVRRYSTERRKLRREVRKVETEFGEVEVKVGLLNGQVVQASPEFESCKAAAGKGKVAIKVVYERALAAFYREEVK